MLGKLVTKIMNGIYKIESPSGKVYIGQSWNIRKRFNAYGAKHVGRQRHLFASFNKYGGKASHLFEVIHMLPPDVDQAVMNTYEQFYMDAYLACGISLLNIKGAGSAGKLSIETKVKIGISGKGKKRSADTCERIRKAKTGFKFSEASKRKMAASKIGIPSPKTKPFAESRKIYLSYLNKGVSLEQKYGKEKADQIKSKISKNSRWRK